MRRLILAAAAAFAFVTPAFAASEQRHPQHVEFGFDKPLTGYDQAAVQRGFQVYREVCASCHGLRLMSFRNLGEKGAPFYGTFERKADGTQEFHPGPGEHGKPAAPGDNPLIKGVAAEYCFNGDVFDFDGVCAPNEAGKCVVKPAAPVAEGATPVAPNPAALSANCRNGTATDRFPNPYKSDAEAIEVNGALPPDLSLIVKARHGGAQYIYSILEGYNEKPPAGEEVPAGKHYNPYFPGGLISMPFQLTPDRVTYEDGTKATSAQMAHAVVTFLAWASEPKRDARKTTGVLTLIFLTILAGLTWLTYKRVWRNIEH
jgi:ubiquinol-cytochrome c reductase cytochrome c1 subunit